MNFTPISSYLFKVVGRTFFSAMYSLYCTCTVHYTQQQRAFKGAVQQRDISGCKQGWAKLVLIALERYSVELKRLTFNLR